jgi:hypothetical protein
VSGNPLVEGGWSGDPISLALRLMAVELLLRPLGHWAPRPVALGLAALALLFPKVLRAPATWLALSALVAVSIALEWPLPDNHIYLLGYWCLAAGLALGATNARATLARSARLLLGLAFTFAVLWKAVLSPDYVDGRFFRVTLLLDERFAATVSVAGGIDRDTLRANRAALQPPPGGVELVDPPEVVQPPAFRRFAAALTWGGLIVEALLALLCFAPSVGWVPRARHAVLLAFCVITYAVAPVAGFGWLLLAMGVALCEPRDAWLARGYVAIWLLVLVYTEVDWPGIAADLLR